MRIIFFGTPTYVLPVLDKLDKAFKSKSGDSPIAAVVTQPPKPVGRKKQLEYSPVDTWAHKKKVPIFFDPHEVNKNQIEADIGILASYGKIITKEVIDHFPFGILNIHPSLLPMFRGSSPVQSTLITGEKAGATIIKIDTELDHGPVITQFKDEVLPDDTTESLRNRLFERSADVLTTLIPAYLQGKITPRQQDHSKATFTREINKEDAFIPPEMLWSVVSGQWTKKKTEWEIGFVRNLTVHCTPNTIHNFIRAMQPWPGAWTLIRQDSSGQARRLKIHKTHLEELVPNAQRLVPDLVQLEGKNTVTWDQFKQGYPKLTSKQLQYF
jgi:methionyl-tRNA formyltransferase